MRTHLGFEPAYSTAEAFADFCRALTPAEPQGAGRA